MAQTKLWQGSGDVYSAASWSPTGPPQPGDHLVLSSGVAFELGGDLAGDTLTIGPSTLGTPEFHSATFIMVDATAKVDVLSPGGGSETDATLVELGRDRLDLTLTAGKLGVAKADIFLAPGAHVAGTLTTEQGGGHSITIAGGPGSTFANEGSTLSFGSAKIEVPVTGAGSWAVGGFGGLEFDSSVGRGQVVTLVGEDTLTINAPHRFHGTVDNNGYGTIDLNNLVADSYSYKNDMLSLWEQGKVVDTLRLASVNGVSVEPTSTGVAVTAALNPNSLPPGTTLLPLHT